jgi:predicted TIM-barrel fold metal-dependent hydrolase
MNSDGTRQPEPMPGWDPFAGLDTEVPREIAATLRELQLVDHHVHGTFTAPITRNQFEESINEGSPNPIPPFMTMFDSQLGFAIRRWAAPHLGLAPGASAEQYWQARQAMSPPELDRTLLPAAGTSHWIVDTGFSSSSISTPAQLASASGATSSEIVRLELLAESVAQECASASEFPDAFRAALGRSAAHAVGFKTIAAYRVGLDIDWSRPTDAAVASAVETWMRRSATLPLRLDDAVVIAFLVHAAAELARPIQFHIGFGDRDLDLSRCDPMGLLPLLRHPGIDQAPIMLLHCWPFHRQAGYLAQAFDNVYFDVGLALNYVGAQAEQIVQESLEVAPFAKQLYSSDAYGPPELHLLGSLLWRRAMGTVVGRWVRRGDWTTDDASRVVRMIGGDNARRVYGLGDSR